MLLGTIFGGEHLFATRPSARNGDFCIGVLLDVMRFQVSISNETFATKLTQPRLETFMNSQMGFEAMLVEELRRAFRAIDKLHGWLLVRVHGMNSRPSNLFGSIITALDTRFLFTWSFSCLFVLEKKVVGMINR